MIEPTWPWCFGVMMYLCSSFCSGPKQNQAGDSKLLSQVHPGGAGVVLQRHARDLLPVWSPHSRHASPGGASPPPDVLCCCYSETYLLMIQCGVLMFKISFQMTYTIAKTYQPPKPGSVLSFQNAALGSVGEPLFLEGDISLYEAIKETLGRSLIFLRTH